MSCCHSCPCVCHSFIRDLASVYQILLFRCFLCEHERCPLCERMIVKETADHHFEDCHSVVRGLYVPR